MTTMAARLRTLSSRRMEDSWRSSRPRPPIPPVSATAFSSTGSGNRSHTGSEPKAFGQQVRDCHLFGAGLSTKKNLCIGAEFKNDLAAGSARRAGAVLFGSNRDGFDHHAWSFSSHGGEYGVAFCTDGEAVGGVFYVASGELRAAPGKDGCSYLE